MTGERLLDFAATDEMVGNACFCRKTSDHFSRRISDFEKLVDDMHRGIRFRCFAGEAKVLSTIALLFLGTSSFTRLFL